jgi:hypothetical protein
MVDSTNMLMQSFCTRRSQKLKKTVISVPFFALGILAVKSIEKKVDEIDPLRRDATPSLRTTDLKRKLWSSGRVLGSQSKDRRFDPHSMLNGSGVNAMPGNDYWFLVIFLLDASND